MKNIKVFSLFVSIFYLFFLSHAIAAADFISDNKAFPYTFSVGASFGLLYGQAEEIVYKDANSSAYLSQLLWDMKPLWYMSSALNFHRINPMEKIGFFADLVFKYGIPQMTGKMEDRDWQDLQSDGLTNFSVHENYTQGAFLGDVALGVSIPIVSKVLLNVYGGFSYMHFSWDSQNGYLQYATQNATGYEPWDASIPKVPIYGPAISYVQEWYIFLLGIGVMVPFNVFSVGLGFQGSAGPFILCYDKDNHYARNLQFEDYLMEGVFLEPKGTFTFSPHPRVDLSWHIGWRFIADTRGKTYVEDTGMVNPTAMQSNNSAGVGYSVLNTELSVKVRF